MLILASASPRRRELLALITGEFQIVTKDTDETVPPSCSPAETVETLARRKALAVWKDHPSGTVIGSDTVVALDERILGKPRDGAHATEMLNMLSGRWHTVYTGVAIAHPGGCEAFVESAQVEFIHLEDADIAAYIATGEPMDKAGAYGIQGRGALFVRGIQGDYYTVMGLPVCRLAEKMRKMGLRP